MKELKKQKDIKLSSAAAEQIWILNLFFIGFTIVNDLIDIYVILNSILQSKGIG